MNAMSSQRTSTIPQTHGSPRQTAQSLTAAIENLQPSTVADSPALPSTASWASRNVSSTLAATPVSNAPTIPSRPASPYALDQALQVLTSAALNIVYDRSLHSDKVMREIDHFPQLFDSQGGRKRYLIAKELENDRLQQEEERNVIGAISTAEDDENLASGSLQLGGEPLPQQIMQRRGESLHQHQPSNPFQPNESHARQSSRYTFSSDSNAVKPAANPRLSQQQAGVLPAAHGKTLPAAQKSWTGSPGSFYSGVQGPPPGLKSSGTPPISGGGMFGQGHGFTSGVPVKEEYEKRELKFPFAQQFALSQAEAAYGGGIEQQKRGKKTRKHRHGNTSSAGGMTDLGDPSILQARMHGQYGGGSGFRWP